MTKVSKQVNRTMRRGRVRSKISGTAERPRVSVFRSNRNLFVQMIDDNSGKTLLSSKVGGTPKTKGTKSELAQKAGELMAKKAKEKGIENVVFDRGGYKYHGRVKALADGLRSGGLKL